MNGGNSQQRDAANEEPDGRAAPVLSDPRDGLPPLTASASELEALAARYAQAHGPVAIDAERASGHRYGQRAYLVQLRRKGAGTALIDTSAVPRLDRLGASIAETEWILHSATQDLPCLADVGMRPTRLFDTELAARMLNMPRVGLASLTESLLGWHLTKGHSAADWSRRPLPEEWLKYAALDVELLIELRDALSALLAEQGKEHWAAQEFDYLTTWSPPERVDPWRRTSGLHQVRTRRALAVVRSLWVARDEVAAQLDRAPGRVLRDEAIISLALNPPASRSELAARSSVRPARRFDTWWAAVQQALALPDDELPPRTAPGDGPPPPRAWLTRDPAAAARLAALRQVVAQVSLQHDLQQAVLVSPDIVRRLGWSPTSADGGAVAVFMADRGARPWQQELLAEPLARALASETVPTGDHPHGDAPAPEPDGE